MAARRNLAVGVVVSLAARIREALQFEPVCRGYHPKIRIGIPPARFEVQASLNETGFEPILKMKFFVLLTLSPDQLVAFNRRNAVDKCLQTGSARGDRGLTNLFSCHYITRL